MPTLGKLHTTFSRITLSGRVIPEIDGLRFVAIALVVIFHIGHYLAGRPPLDTPQTGHPWYTHFSRYGHYGVELFFVISGFVLALPFASHHVKGTPKVDLKRYYIRRLTRIAPPYLLITIVVYFGAVWFQGLSAASLFPNFIASLVYLHSLMFGQGSVFNPVAWSLEIEIQFYLLIPFLTLLFAVSRTFTRRVFIVILGFAFLNYQILFMPDGGALYFTIVNYLQYFLAGFLLADLYLREWQEDPVHEWRWDFIAVVGIPLLFFVSNRLGLFRLMLPILMFVFCIAAFRSVWVHGILTNFWIITIGGMSYSIYLLHYQLLPVLGAYTSVISFTDSFSVNFILQLLIFGPLLVAVSAIYYLLVERPCMRKDWPRQVLQRVKYFRDFVAEKTWAP
jgi:peptidoglycan/LPS O-acetylase OafA/YrhL